MDDCDRIRVLLIDDEPGTLASDISGTKFKLPKLREDDDMGEPLGIAEHFELRWLASPGEAKEFRDLVEVLRFRRPEQLGLEGFIPEIICFDYAMTGDTTPVEKRHHVPPDSIEDISPLPSLRRLAKPLGISVSTPGEFPSYLERPARTDCYGLYMGVLVFDSFSEHPVAPVAVTRYPNQTIADNQDGQFFEWFLRTDHAGTFQRRGRPAPSWSELLTEGVQVLQSQICELFRLGLLGIDLGDLVELSRNAGHASLVIESRYGIRRLPVRGLFIGASDEEIKDWALETFHTKVRSSITGERETITDGLDLDVIRRAIAATKELWDARLDQDDKGGLTRKRMKLSELVEAGESAEANPELEEFIKDFDADLQKDACLKEADWVCEMRCYDKTLWRWIVLFMTVRVMHHRYCGARNWRDRCNKEGWTGAVKTLMTPPVSFQEVYAALFPRPYQPIVIPWKDPTSKWGNQLKLNAIRPNEAIAAKGISPVEQMFMQDYALNLGFTKAQWSSDDQTRVILGEDER